MSEGQEKQDDQPVHTDSQIVRGFATLMLRKGMPTSPVLAGTVGGVPIGALAVKLIDTYLLPIWHLPPLSATLAAGIGGLISALCAYVWKGRIR